jgi:hypothetical protein
MKYALSLDPNGNRILRVWPANSRARGFSIQTNGNLPVTHRNGICFSTPLEVAAHVRLYGTARQKEILNNEK